MKDSIKGNPTGFGNPDDCMSYVIEQGYEDYTPAEHGVWKTLYERQRDIVKGRGCKEYIKGMDALGIDEHAIPNFEEASKVLKAKTGWEVVAVEGLIPDLPFFKLLSERKFPAGHFIRKPHQLDYIEEPDVFHDFFGHVPMLADPVFADYIQAYGAGGLRAIEFDCVPNLSRLYWYTVEFGLIKTDEGMRIYGAGILSSPGETVFALENDSPHRLEFDLKRVMQTEYCVDDYQQTYFAIESFDQLFKETYADFSDVYNVLKTENKTYASDEVAQSDVIIHRGSQTCPKSKV